MTKNIYILLLLLFYSLTSNAQLYDWANGTQLIDEASGRTVCLDPDGNAIVLGWFEGTQDLDPGDSEVLVTSNGEDDVFIQKFSATGEFIWGISYGGTDYDWSYGIDTDSEGNIYIGGFFYNTVDFDAGPGVENRTAVNNRDAYILKLNPDGEFQWVYNFGGFGWDVVFEIKVDAADHPLVVGRFSSVLDIDIGDGVTELDNSVGNMFLMELSADGDFVSATEIGGINYYMDMALDADENIYLTGCFNGTVDFDTGPDVLNLTSAGWSDIFVLKITHEGELIWVKGYGGTERDFGESIAVDPDGNVFVSGHFKETCYFDYGIFDYTLHAAGGDEEEDAFILKLEPDGETAWAKRIGGEDKDRSYSVLVDNDGNSYFGGFFEGEADLDPDPYTTDYHIASRSWFFEKLSPEGDLEWIKTINFPGTQEFQGAVNDAEGNIYITGRFSGAPDFDPGPGEALIPGYGISSYLLKLSECGVVASTINDTACFSYTVESGDETYYETGVYYDTIMGEGGCDLVQTINLQINPTYETVQNITSCFEYTHTDTDSTYTSDGTYTDTLYSISGCDSLIITNITIFPEFEMDVIITDIELTVEQVGMTYQWVDCLDDYTPIDGAINQSFEATENGTYAVIVSNDDCSDTSECYVITEVGIPSYEALEFSVYPNPSQKQINILHGLPNGSGYSIKLYAIHGELIIEKLFIAGESDSFEFNGDSGIYFVQLCQPYRVIGTIKMVKQ